MLKRFRRVMGKSLAALGGLVLLWAAVAAVSFWIRREPLPDRFLVTLHLSGALQEQASGDPGARFFRGDPLTMREVVAALERAAEDDRVQGVLFRLAGVRMGFGQLQELRDAVLAFRESGKAAVAFADTFGEFGPGNGAYYLATAFDEIAMQPSGDVGVTGLSTRTQFFRGALDKLGVVPRLEGREEYKTFKNAFTETGFTEPHRESLESLMEGLFGQMVRGVAAARGLEEAEVRALMDEAPLSAEKARAAGLLDRLAYWDQVREALRERLGETPRGVGLARYLRRAGDPYGDDGPELALIVAEGGIQRGRSGYNPLTGEAIMGAETMAEAIRSAADDADVRGILLRVNSPGGSYIGSDTIWREVVRAESLGKPVVVSMANVAGSGGYFISMPAHRIVAQPGTLTGSIGIFAGKLITREFWNRLGITFEELHTSDNGDFWSPLKDYDKEQWRQFQAWLDRAYDDFTAKVARGRNLSPERVKEIAKGRVWTGQDALALGLVDALGGYPRALALLREAAGIEPEAPVRLRPFPRPQSLLSALLNGEMALGRSVDQALAPVRPLFRMLDAISVPPGDRRLRTPPGGLPGAPEGW
jgi:protease-4